jgi:hypothetical protein
MFPDISRNLPSGAVLFRAALRLRRDAAGGRMPFRQLKPVAACNKKVPAQSRPFTRFAQERRPPGAGMAMPRAGQDGSQRGKKTAAP